MSVGAYTAPGGSYPPYINIQRLPNGAYKVTVRSPATATGACGDSAAMEIEFETLVQVVLDAIK